MATTGPYLPVLPVTGTVVTTTGFGLPVVRALNWAQGTPASGDEERPFAVLTQTVAQSLGNNSLTPILFDSEDIDTGNNHSTSSNTGRFTCTRGGWYEATGQVSFATNATGDRFALFRINGTIIKGTDSTTAAGSHQTVVNVADRFFLAAASYLELCGEQYSGGALNTDLVFGSRLTVRMIRAQ